MSKAMQGRGSQALLHVEDGVGVICKDDSKAKPIINGEEAKDHYTNLSKENLLTYPDFCDKILP